MPVGPSPAVLDNVCDALGQMLAEQTQCPVEVLNSLLDILQNRCMESKATTTCTTRI